MQGLGETPRPPVHREQEARERRRKRSLVAGAIGLAALFGGGIIGIAVPGWIGPVTIVIVAGVVLLVVAFLLAGGSTFVRAQRSRER